MKAILALLCVFLVSCATHPKAIIPSPAEVEKLNVAPVVNASEATRDAVREVADAGQASREAGRKVSDTARRLSDALARSEAIAMADRTKLEELAKENTSLRSVIGDMREIITDLENESMELAAAQAFSEEKEKLAITTVDSLMKESSILKADTQAQAVQIDRALLDNEALRVQVQELAKSSEARVVAEEKLRWWRWIFAPVSISRSSSGCMDTPQAHPPPLRYAYSMKIPTNPIRKSTLLVGATCLVGAMVCLVTGHFLIGLILALGGGINLTSGAILKRY